MNRLVVVAAIGCVVACGREHPPAPASPLAGRHRAGDPVALFNNGGFESGTLNNWTVETFLNTGVNYPTVNGTTVPPQTLADLNLQPGGIANTAAAGPATTPQVPNGLSAATTLRWPIYGLYSVVVNGQHDVSMLNGTFPYGANQNVNSVKQDMVVASSDVDPMDGLPHVRFVVAPVLQNPNHTNTQQPYYFMHVKNLTTGQELFNRFNYVAQPGVPWQTDAGGTIEYLAWQAVDVASPGLINVGDDVQAQVIAAGCSLGGHWGEAYADAFGAFLPGISVVARQPQFANEGTSVTAAYTVNNAASAAQTNVVVTLPTPNNATFASFTPPSGMTCSGVPAVGSTGTITCTVASMNPLSALSFNIVWKANSGLTLPADMGNGGYGVKSDQQAFLLGMPATTYLTDPNAVQYADYSVAIDDGVTAVAPGQTLTYTIVVKNNGPATPVTRRGALAAVPVVETNSTGGLTGISWTCTAAGTAGTLASACGAASGTGLINSTAQLVAGGTATYVVTATAATPTSGNYINNAISATASGLPAGYGDPDSSNNTLGDTDLVGALVNITLNKDTTAPAGTGKVTSAPAGVSCATACTAQTAQFVTGAQITLTAVADPSNSFSGWTAGPCNGSPNPQCTFTPSAATTLTARFLPPSYAITATSGGNGTIVCTSPVYQGQSSTCTISPATGYALASLTDNGADVLASVTGGNTYTISNAQAAHTVAAGFLKTLGTACGAAGECGSGNCVDGVCCNSACSGQCNACNVNAGAVTPGTCTIISGAPVGTRAACTTDGSSCGGACDGTSATACTYPGSTTACRAASCAAGTQVSAASCNGTGTCPASASAACTPYVCGATACKTSCTVDTDCVSSDYCSAGACVPKVAQGGACTAATQCGTGSCVDGVCCNTACSGQCQACDVAGSVGVCTAVSGAPHGTRTACLSDGSACGGSCNGTNTASCTYPVTQCRTATCLGGVQTAAASCSNGSCPAPATAACTPYVCGASACKTSCTVDTDCVSGDYCSAGACVPKVAQGGACTAANQCGTGSCVDGVCCNTACSGQCQACDVAGSVGVCTAVSGAPHGARTACLSDGTACGGSCDGTNTASCAYPTSQCRGASCAAGTATLAASCSGGSCPAVQTQACSPYVCGTTACKTSCAVDTDCVSGDYCSAGACVPKVAQGAACTGANQCGTGNCVDGVCCNTACGGQCNACNVTPGTCTVVSGAPVGGRAACASDGSACGGSCDGTNAASCAYPTAQCRGASCANGTATLAASCASGSCPAPQTQACNQYVCGPTACKTSCTADTDCIAGDYCNAAQQCVPKLADGSTCSASAQCVNNSCVDGVCCNTACGGQCQACDVAGKIGVCSAVSGAPHGTRAACASDGTSCGGSCDGTNTASCAYPTAQCRGASCTAGVQTLAASCSGGACPAAVTQSCGSFGCGATACNNACTTDANCSAANYCSNGLCTPKLADGSACTASNACTNGNCVDGVCCNTACTGQCQACDVTGSVGVCTPVTGAPHGTRTACATDGTACGGSCDGTSTASCVYPTAQCRGASCANGTATLAASCVGGSCPTVQTQSCTPYVCGATACNGNCATDAQCVTGDWCSAGVCVPKQANGQTCSASTQCTSGSCVDGVCCNTACNGQCESCNATGSVGVCTAVLGAPTGGRAACAGANTLCGGSCDGTLRTSCTYPGAGTSCGAASCSGGVATLAAGCNGAGACSAAQTQSCSPYVCGTTACKGNCAVDGDCIASDYCSAGICVARQGNGATCSAADQCQSGNCVDGFCCNGACSGQCEACDVSGLQGICSPVPAASQPHAPRAGCTTDGSSCGGACDGATRTACAYPTIQCRGPACSAGVATLVAACDGAGKCPAPQSQACAPYLCSGSACAGNCAQDTDCVAGDFCSAGVCTPKLVQGGACASDAQCGTGHCVDGVCCNTACTGQCEACNVAGSAGTCAPVVGAPRGSRAACASDGSSCGGSCDGTSRASCAYPVSECRAATACVSGVKTDAASCDGTGRCPARVQESCTPPQTSCRADSDCAAAEYCSAGFCKPRGTWVVAGTGGCTSTGAATWPLLLVAIAFALRRRKLAGAAAAALALAGAARAQGLSTSITVDHFQPGAGAYDVLGVSSPETARDLDWHASAFADYARDPLRLIALSPVPGVAQQVRLLRDQSLLHLGGSIGLGDQFELGAVLPVALAQGSGAAPFLGGPLQNTVSSSGFGDLRLLPKVRLFRDERMVLGASLPVSLPSGRSDAFLGTGTLTASPTALLELQLPVRVLANAGLILRPGQKLSNLKVGTALSYGVAGELPFGLRNQRLAAMTTLQGEINLAQGGSVERPMELMGALKWSAVRGLDIVAGGGPGLSNGYGTPRFRLFFSIAFTPEALPKGRVLPVRLPPEPPLHIAALMVRNDPPPAVIESAEVPIPEEQPEPELAKFDAATGKIDLLAPVWFREARDVLLPESRGVLNSAANVLNAHPEVTRIRIEGHTDNQGKPAYNKSLSQRRAKAVMKYLIGRGIDPKRLEYAGYGDERPVDNNDTEPGRARNRRVELVVVNSQLAAAQ